MRTEPTWRIPFGVLLMFVGLIAYAVVIARYAPGLIGDWPIWGQTIVYIALGVIWIRPLRRFLIWMETGRTSAPDKNEPD